MRRPASGAASWGHGLSLNVVMMVPPGAAVDPGDPFGGARRAKISTVTCCARPQVANPVALRQGLRTMAAGQRCDDDSHVRDRLNRPDTCRGRLDGFPRTGSRRGARRVGAVRGTTLVSGRDCAEPNWCVDWRRPHRMAWGRPRIRRGRRQRVRACVGLVHRTDAGEACVVGFASLRAIHPAVCCNTTGEIDVPGWWTAPGADRVARDFMDDRRRRGGRLRRGEV